MKAHLFSFLAAAAVLCTSSSLEAQTFGCTYTFAPEYDPGATVNDGTCTYDVQTLLDQGYCIQELMAEGLPGYVFLEKVLAMEPNPNTQSEMAKLVIASVSESDQKILLVYDSGTASHSDANFSWGCHGADVGGTVASTFAGESNTLAIITNDCHLNDGQTSAAEYCYNFSAFGIDNWFLPTQADAQYAFQNLNYASKYNSSGYRVWTSTEAGSYDGVSVRPNGNQTGYQDSQDKSQSYLVMPVHYITIGDLCSGNSNQGCEAWGEASNSDLPCDYPLFSCDSVTSSVWSNLPTDVYPTVPTQGEIGLNIDSDILLNFNAELDYDGNTYSVQSYAVASVDGLPQGLSAGTLQDVTFTDGSSSNTQCLELVGVPAEVGVFELAVTLNVGVDLFGSTVTIPGVVVTHTLSILENPNGIPGCTYDFAENYSPIATIDDGSCVLASIYTCPNDLDGNGIVGVGDILELLGSFDVTCE